MTTIDEKMEADKFFAQTRKQQLMNRVKQKQNLQRQTSAHTFTHKNETIPANGAQSSKDIRKQEKENIRLQNKLQEKQQECVRQNRELQTLKQELFELKQKYQQLEEEHADSSTLLTITTRELSEYKAIAEEAVPRCEEAEKRATRFMLDAKGVQRKLSKVLNQDRNFDQQISQLQNEIDKLKIRPDELMTELRKTQGKLKEALKPLSMSELIEELTQKRSYIHEKDFKKLYRLMAALEKTFIPEEEEPTEVTVFGKLGYVIYENETYMFYDLQDRKYPLSDIPDRIRDGAPARAYIQNDKATILELYPVSSKRPKPGSKQRKKTLSAKEERDYIPFGDITVLIVGIENKQKYMDRILKHGATPVWHDPIEESEHRLRSKLNQAHIVLVCDSHIRHSVIDIIGDDTQGVHRIKIDNEESIATRTYYALVNGFVRKEIS